MPQNIKTHSNGGKAKHIFTALLLITFCGEREINAYLNFVRKGHTHRSDLLVIGEFKSTILIFHTTNLVKM